MRRYGENGRHEGLFHLAHLRAIVLQERLVPNAPMPIEVGITAKTRVGSIVFSPIILLKSCFLSKGQEPHATPNGPMKEGGVVALVRQYPGQTREIVHRLGRKHKRLDKHGDATKHRRHAVDAFAPVAIRVFVGGALFNQFVYIGRIAFVIAAFQVFI